MRNGPPKLSPRAVAYRDRARRAVELRKAGLSFEKIAELCGYSDKGNAYHAIQTALRNANREAAAELIEVEMARLDDMITGLWPKARAGSPEAVAAVLKIMERRAKMTGIDAAAKHEIRRVEQFEGWTDAELERFAATGERPGRDGSNGKGSNGAVH